MVGSLLVVFVDGRRRMWAIRKAVGFAHGLRGFGATVEVCSREVSSGWYLPSIHHEGRAAVLTAADGGSGDGRGDRSEVTQLGADVGRLRAHVTQAHVTLGPGEGRPWGDAKPVDHNRTPPRPMPVSRRPGQHSTDLPPGACPPWQTPEDGSSDLGAALLRVAHRMAGMTPAA